MWRLIIQGIMIVLIAFPRRSSGDTAKSHKLPLWTWECINEKCMPLQATEVSKLQSLQTCNMLCASLQLWPQPTGPVSLSTTAVPVRSDLFRLQIISHPSRAVQEHLQDAFQLLRDDLHQMENRIHGFEEWRSVFIRVTVNESVDPRMRIDTDESYSLSLHPEGNSQFSLTVDISANSFCGARHAFETLSQLVWPDPNIGSLLILEAAKVEDAPKFKYRGLMLDTARNFIPVNEILRTITAMSACKLNTFHWHATDAQAFSLKLDSVPQLSEYGAYGPGAVYTTEDIRAIVQHARLRGIRVIIEVDTPAHVGRAWSWGHSAGIDHLIYCMEMKSESCNEPPCGQLNPRNAHLYDILERVYSEIIHLTGVDDIFHLGGDDVSQACWAQHFTDKDPMEVWLEYTRSLFQRLEYVNGRLPNLTLLWSSHLSQRLKSDLKDYVHAIGLQVRSVVWAKKYESGVRTVMSHEDAWDLNSGLGNWYEESDGAPYNTWQRVYEHRPWSRHSPSCAEGGEVTVWSSMVSTGGLDAHVWPRAAAFAERVWSDRAEGATRPVHARLDVHRSRLVSRGIQAAPIWSMWCTHNTYTCG